MKAIVIREAGGPEVLELRDVPEPAPTRGEARVRIRATAINRADVLQRMGVYPAPAGSPSDIPGMEYAGEVDAVGEDVTNVALGDRVFGIAGGGTYAEKIVLPARTIAHAPRGMSFTDAASIPEVFITALDAIHQARLRAGDRVLISAVGSGVGTAATQIACALGARPYGTARTQDKIDRAKKLGLVDGVATKDARFANAFEKMLGAPNVFDVILELAGGAYVTEDLACVALNGRIVVIGLVAGPQAEISLGALLHRRATIIGTTLRARPLEEKILAARMLEHELVSLFEDKKILPVIDRVLPLSRVSEAHAAMQNNETFGKIVLEL